VLFALHVQLVELRSGVSVDKVRNDKKAMDQTNAENRADLFRVHLLRGRGLTEEIVGSNDCTRAQRCGGLSSLVWQAKRN